MYREGLFRMLFLFMHFCLQILYTNIRHIEIGVPIVIIGNSER